MSEIPEEDQKYLRDTYERIQKYLHSSDGPGLLKISEITRHLFISNLSVSCDIEKIRAENIRAILYIGEHDKQQSTLKTYQKKKISHKFINLEDNPRSDIIPIFEPCYDFIHSFIAKEKKVLVHCVAGVSRSPSVVAYYFLKRYYFVNFSKGNAATQRRLISRKWYILPEIIAMIKNSRPCIEPNGGFVQKLILMEYQLKRYFEDVYHNDPARLEEKSLASKLDELDTLNMDDSDNEDEKKDEYDNLGDLEDIDP